MLTRRSLTTGLALGPLVLLAACSGSSDEPTETPEQVLSAAKDKLVAAKYVTLSLTSTGVPSDKNGVSAADGKGEISATEPKFEGTVQGRVDGLTANLQMIGIGDEAWWKLFTPDYTVADLASVNSPNPASFFHAETGLPGLLSAATEVTAGAKSRQGQDVLTSYSGKLPGKVIEDLFHLGDGTGTFDVDFGITDDGELRKALTTGPFYEGTTSTYTLLLTDYGTPVTITAPL